MRIFLLSLLLATSGASAAEAEKYGIDLPAGAVVPVSTAMADLDSHAGKPQKFSGRITDVCQKEGCWVMLEDEGQTARVLLGDHDFYIPKDVRGPAVVYGVMTRRPLSKAAAATSDEVAVPEYEVRIVAEGVEVAG